MMKLLQSAEDFRLPSLCLIDSQTKKNKIKYNDTVITFDIETTSYSFMKLGSEYKQGLCYIWMLSVDGHVFYGRYLSHFIQVLQHMKERDLGRLIIYIHNLGFEFEFLRGYIDMTVFARAPHKPIKATSDDLNVEFRCSYFLYNMSLQKVGEKVGVPKLIGDLDYSLIRTPETPMTLEELGYCENDVVILDAAIRSELPQYKDVAHIPLTHTGRIRLRVQEIYKDDFRYRRQLRRQLVKTLPMFLRQQWTFSGGYTHANATYQGDIIPGVYMYDIASSYPTEMVLGRVPGAWTKWKETDLTQFDPDGNYCWMLNLKFTGISCQTQNTYISYSKTKSKNPDLDNGRVVSADELILWCTEYDFDIIRQTYKWDSVEVLESWRSKKRYLDIKYVKLILELYVKKTALKGIKGKEDEYNRTKELINSCYGMMVTQTIRDEVVFNGHWGVEPLTDEKVEELLIKQTKKWNHLLNFSWGIWITAMARHSLWQMIIANDDIVIYCDTDSLKTEGSPRGIEEYNKKRIEQAKKVAAERHLDPELFAPLDSKGKAHPLGVFESEGVAARFKTLGAKKYALERDDGSLELTVAGVNKEFGAAYLKEHGGLEAFSDGYYFPPEAAKSMIVQYPDFQIPYELTDYLGNKFLATETAGVYMEPRGYRISQQPYYLEFSNMRATIYRRGVIYDG